jgi:hypothetical protein
LVVDDFGVKYVGREHVNHLIKCIKEKYELTEDWSGNLYCGIKLHWDYIARTVDISMPGYIKKLLHKYKHKMPTKPQHCPYTPAPKQYGAEAQAPFPIDISPKLSDEEIKEFNESSGAFYITHERSTSRSSWPSAQSQANKHEAPRTRWQKPNNC